MSYKIYGAIGFAVGGLITGLAGDYMLIAFIFFGMIGSAVLSIPAHSKKLTIFSSLLGAIGFFVGFTIPMFVSLSLFDLGFPFIGIIMGLFGGALLGTIYRNIKGFILWGMIGFGIWGLLIDVFRPFYETIHPAIVMMVASGIAGALLGHAATLAKNTEAS